MELLRYFLAAALLLLFGILAVANGWALACRMMRRQHCPSWVPFIGGLAGIGAAFARVLERTKG